ncbi:MAG: 2-amino-4-hydroxy-6-hydroxymethyldihydropteridine diphosphokinase, partial [Sphaerochaetaceae bacterium]
DPKQNIEKAIVLLKRELEFLKVSNKYQSKAVGSAAPDFINVALLVNTSVSKEVLKETILKPIENKLGRLRTEDKNSPRTIDIDIVFYDNELLDKQIYHYPHIAVPVSELLPQFKGIGEALNQFNEVWLV